MRLFRLTTVGVAAILSMAAPVHGKSFDFDSIDVLMDVQSDGRIFVTETWDCVLDGDVNGGSRTIGMKGISDITDITLTEGTEHAYRVFFGKDRK